MQVITATATCKADSQGYRIWDLSWIDGLGRKRGQVSNTTVARLQREYDELTYLPLNVKYEIVTPKQYE